MANEGAAIAANLTYYIFEGTLVGHAGGRGFHLSAMSGGGGGSRVNAPDSNVNNPYATGVKTVYGSKHVHGGPLPTGTYTIKKPARHPTLGLSAYLDPDPGNEMMSRSRFYIHGRGRHGSDGCIVPMSSFAELMAALGRSGGGTLLVEETLGGARFA